MSKFHDIVFWKNRFETFKILASSFVIDYKGEPVVISSMRVRITNPDGSLAGVGVDNTMFFELIKANVDLSA